MDVNGSSNRDSSYSPTQMSSISISYTHSSDQGIHPGASTVILNPGQSAMFMELARSGMPIYPKSYRNGADRIIHDAELLTAEDILDYDNARTLQKYFGSVRRGDWKTFEQCIDPNITYWWNWKYGSNRGNTMEGHIQAMKSWRAAHGNVRFDIHRVMIGKSQAFLTWRVGESRDMATDVAKESFRTWADRGYLVKPFCEWLLEKNVSIDQSLEPDLSRSHEKQSESDDLRDNLIRETSDWHKPQTYIYKDGIGLPIKNPMAELYQVPEVEELKNQALGFDPPTAQTTYYTFSKDHLITSIQTMENISGKVLLTNRDSF